MEIKLYQINLDRDEEGLAFMGQDYLSKQKDDPTRIDSQIYDCVFEGEVDCSSPEDVFAMFNFEHPDGYKGRSMSVSDVVICAPDGGAPSAYFCDSIGFKQVQFDEELAKTLQTEMTVVLLEPGKLARVATIDACRAEFGSDADFADLRQIGIGYTTITDAEHDIQAYANLIDHRIEIQINWVVAQYYQYESLADMVANGLPDLEFDSLTYLPEWLVKNHVRNEIVFIDEETLTPEELEVIDDGETEE